MIAVKGSPKYYKLIQEYFQGFQNTWNCGASFYYYVVINGIVEACAEHQLPEGIKTITYKELLEL